MSQPISLSNQSTTGFKIEPSSDILLGLEPRFILREVHFEKLKNSNKPLSDWAIGIFLTTFGFFLNVFVIDIGDGEISHYIEYTVGIFGFITSFGVFYLKTKYPTEREKMMTKLQKHFDENTSDEHFLVKQERD